MVDLDATKLICPSGNDQDLPPLPEPEGSVLKNHLKQVRAKLFFYGLRLSVTHLLSLYFSLIHALVSALSSMSLLLSSECIPQLQYLFRRIHYT